jgi:hypothetical protein
MVSGCSESINSPFSPETQLGETGLTAGGETGPTGGNGVAFLGSPSESWNNYVVNPRILTTIAGESLSEADITLEYDSELLPPGVELRVVFTNPRSFEFHIVPPGQAKKIPVEVTIDCSKVDLEGGDEGDLEPIVLGIENNQMTEIESEFEEEDMMLEFETISDFSRYALARD